MAIERIHVIDSDLGRSGAEADHRDGFQQLITEVALGHAGIVLGLEVSRLARNNADWHRLIELAALSHTLILDEDGIYDPAHFNDRLLLGLKGTMSEAELHVLEARLQGGIRNKARRGELELPLPIGLVYGADGAVALDPDRQIQEAVRLLFETFRQSGSASAVVRRFRQEGWRFPRRIRRGVGKGDVLWGGLDHSRVIQILHNPRYAGAFVYGRTRGGRNAQLKSIQRSTISGHTMEVIDGLTGEVIPTRSSSPCSARRTTPMPRRRFTQTPAGLDIVARCAHSPSLAARPGRRWATISRRASRKAVLPRADGQPHLCRSCPPLRHRDCFRRGPIAAG